MPLLGRKYYYAFGITDEGRNSLLGPYDSAEEASAAASGFNRVKIFPFPSSDRARAAQAVKASLLQHKAQSPDDAMRPMLRRILPRRSVPADDSATSGNLFEDV